MNIGGGMGRERGTVLLALLTVPALASAHSVSFGDGRSGLWLPDPLSLAVLTLLAWAYWRGRAQQRRRPQANPDAMTRRGWYFWAGWAVLLIALASPLDPMGEHLFSAHMIQHELLMLVAAPLLVLSRPSAALLRGSPDGVGRVFARLVSGTGLRRSWDVLVSPLSAWTIHAVVLWGWHLPGLFEASLHSTGIHILQHLSFLWVALLFWYSLMKSDQAGAGTAVVYLFTTAIHASGLGALLTFSPHVWYEPYLATAPAWGLSALEDQQLGGLIMWMPSGLVYVVAGLVAVMHMLTGSDHRLQRHGQTSAGRNGGQGNVLPGKPD